MAKYILIGGGLAATKAAEQLRRLDAEASITLVSDEPELPYDKPPLSKEYLQGEWDDTKILLNPPEFYEEKQITVKLGNPARSIDTPNKLVTLTDDETLEYDKLLLATGARARAIDLPGADLDGVYYLRRRSDSAAIRDAAKAGAHAVLIGAGFIGMEVAASLTQRGVHVTVLEAAPYIWSRFLDKDMAEYFQRRSQEKGVVLHAGVAPVRFTGEKHVTGVAIEGGVVIPADFVCVGVGVELNIDLATETGLLIDNGVVTNEYLETSAPDVYAAGDIVNYYDPIFEKRRRLEHWGHAEYTGLLAAQNMFGNRAPYDLLSYVWSDIFNLHIEFAGEEKEYDETILRGDRDSDAFVLMYLKEHRLRAYLAVNTSPRNFLPMQRMIRQRTDLRDKKAQLADGSVEMRGLLG